MYVKLSSYTVSAWNENIYQSVNVLKYYLPCLYEHVKKEQYFKYQYKTHIYSFSAMNGKGEAYRSILSSK